MKILLRIFHCTHTLRLHHHQNLEEQHMANKEPSQNKILNNFTSKQHHKIELTSY